jgi:hypothetical protein
MTSAYPKQLDELIRDAQRISRELGAIPSQNKLKAALHVRSERARAVLNTLRETGFDPADTAGHAGCRWFPTVLLIRPRTVQGNRLPQTSARVRIRFPQRLRGSSMDGPGRSCCWPRPRSSRSGPAGSGSADSPGSGSCIRYRASRTTSRSTPRSRFRSSIGAGDRTRRFAKWSAVGALVLGAAGQVAYHLMIAGHVSTAPWWITTAVSCLPVVVLGFGAALAHLQHPRRDRTEVGR